VRARKHTWKRCYFCMEAIPMPLRLHPEAAFVRDLDLLQRRMKSDLAQLGYARMEVCNRTYINERLRRHA